MKTIFSIFAALGICAVTVTAQQPATSLGTASPTGQTITGNVTLVPHVQPVAPATAATPLEQLKLIHAQNVKLLDQQNVTLRALEELEKASLQLKFWGKRS